MNQYCQERDFLRKKSINDDLEILVEDLKTGKLPSYRVDTYFLPELTKVEMKDPNFHRTFRFGFCLYKFAKNFAGINSQRRPSVDKNENEISDSKSKFILTKCKRSTYRIVLTPDGRTSHSLRNTTKEDYPYRHREVHDEYFRRINQIHDDLDLLDRFNQS